MSGKNEYKLRLQRMVEYIEQDGHEKAEELDVLAEEEYYMERKGYIEHRIGAVTKYYDNLENKYGQQIVLDVSRIKNEAYKSVLNARNSILVDVFEQASARMRHLTHDDNACLYKKVLYELVIQGLVKMMEPDVLLRARKKDVGMTKKVLKQAQDFFLRETGMTVKLSVDEERCLPESSGGGLFIATRCGGISVNNTLEARLELIRSQMIPQVRMMLFGPNPNRKHPD